MKKLSKLLLSLLFVICIVTQVQGQGYTVSGQLSMPDGATNCSAIGLPFAADTDTGFSRAASNKIAVCVGGTGDAAALSTEGVYLTGATADKAYIVRDSTVNVEGFFGAFDNGFLTDEVVVGSYTNHDLVFVTNNTWRMRVDTTTGHVRLEGNAAHSFSMDRHTTTNTAGSNFTIQAGGATSAATDKDGGKLIRSPGANTGTGRSWMEGQCYSTATTSGTGDGTSFTCIAEGVYKALTDGVATNLVNLTLANNTANSIRIDYSIEVIDGSDLQIEDGFVICRAYNDAGAVAGNTCTETSTQTLQAGTLSTDWAISAANPAVVSLNANTSLTASTGYPRIRWHGKVLGHQAMAVQ